MIKQTTFKNTLLLIVVLLISFSVSMGQTDSTNVLRNNFIKINLISLPPLINNLNQKWIGVEYQRLINKDVSFSVITDFGVFEDYTYTKYYDYFDEDEGFSYTREDVRIPGYHIIPSFRYLFVHPVKKANFGIYATVNLDYYQYFLKREIYYSSTDNTISNQNSTYRFNIGVGAGVQYIAFNRFSFDLNISLFTKLFSRTTSVEFPELYPENSFWRSNNNSSWATINLMLGYAFGEHKKQRTINTK